MYSTNHRYYGCRYYGFYQYYALWIGYHEFVVILITILLMCNKSKYITKDRNKASYHTLLTLWIPICKHCLYSRTSYFFHLIVVKKAAIVQRWELNSGLCGYRHLPYSRTCVAAEKVSLLDGETALLPLQHKSRSYYATKSTLRLNHSHSWMLGSYGPRLNYL